MKPSFLENFQDIREKNIMNIKQIKENGGKVVGMYCTYCPREMVLATGAVPIGLCGTKEEPIAAAEKDLPRNLCPLIKSSYGFGATDTCPYFHFSDIVIGETTCDGKKKMFELMQKFKPMHVMNLPQIPDAPGAVNIMRAELERLQGRLEEEFGIKISEEALREGIHIVNEENRAMKSLFDLNQAKPALMSGVDMLTVAWQIGFNADRKEGIAMIDKLVAEVKEMAAQGLKVGDENTPRILVTGTPVGVGSEKVIKLVEECGGLVVAMENCGGYKTVNLHINENDKRDPLSLLAEKYLQIPCSVMMQNHRRMELLEQMIKDFQVDGVIDLTWQACHTYNVESYYVAELVKDKMGLPFLQLETDYSNSDRETLRVRIEAFLEMM
ncbi:MAG: double-cubane-cluster-containing anaerobic reductase [Candidatus Saccharibacteria bacterium]